MAFAKDWEFQYSNDVYTDPGKLRLGGKFSSKVGLGGLEYMGYLCGNWMSPRYPLNHGHNI